MSSFNKKTSYIRGTRELIGMIIPRLISTIGFFFGNITVETERVEFDTRFTGGRGSFRLPSDGIPYAAINLTANHG